MTAAPASAPDSLSRVRERAGVRARQLRSDATDAEARLWYHLRNRNFLGLKFRRQHPIGPFIADFACVDLKLVIELDGGQHAESDEQRRDADRAAFMRSQGWQTLRFWNHDVLQQTNAVLEQLRQVAQTLTPTLSRMREREQDKDRSTP